MTEMTALSTVAAKEAFERLSVSHNVRIRHYHCDNGLFDFKALKLPFHSLIKPSLSAASTHITRMGRLNVA